MAFASKYGPYLGILQSVFRRARAFRASVQGHKPYMGILQSVLDARGAFRASVQGHKKVSSA